MNKAPQYIRVAGRVYQRITKTAADLEKLLRGVERAARRVQSLVAQQGPFSDATAKAEERLNSVIDKSMKAGATAELIDEILERVGSLGTEDDPEATYPTAHTAALESYVRGTGVKFYIRALLTSKTGKNLPGVDAGFTKRRGSIPRELKRNLTAAQSLAAKQALSQDSLWYCKIEGKGWDWTARNGAKHVPAIHSCIEYLKRFSGRDRVDGVTCIFAEVENELLGR